MLRPGMYQGGVPRLEQAPTSQYLFSMQHKVYLVEAVLISFLLGIVEKGTLAQAQSMVHQVLDLFWLFMEVRFLALGYGRHGEGLGKAWNSCPSISPQDYEVQDCLKQLMMSLLRLYRFSPIVPDLSLQVRAPVPTLSPLSPTCPFRAPPLHRSIT